MFKAIWKYRWPPEGPAIIMAPSGSVPLCVQDQGNEPSVWFEVDPDAPKSEEWRITAIGTGDIFDAEEVGSYLGTVQFPDCVVHYFAKRVE